MTDNEPLPEDAPEPRPTEQHEHDRPHLCPQVWIGSLADYNAGLLHGAWTPADVETAELIRAAGEIVARAPCPDAEEWAIFDYDGFYGFTVGEYAEAEVVTAVARGIREHGPAFAAWAELHDADPDILGSFAEAYLGAYDSHAAWAAELAANLDVERRIEAVFPGPLGRYIRFDEDSFARDAWLGGDVELVDRNDGQSGMWVFRVG